MFIFQDTLGSGQHQPPSDMNVEHLYLQLLLSFHRELHPGPLKDTKFHRVEERLHTFKLSKSSLITYHNYNVNAM